MDMDMEVIVSKNKPEAEPAC